MDELLTACDLRGVLRVLEAVEGAETVATFGEATLEALGVAFGYRSSAFFVTGRLGEPMTPSDAAVRGMPADHAEHWQEYWGQFEPLGSRAAVELERRYGTVDLEQLHCHLRPMQRRYVTDFLHPGGIETQLAFHLEPGCAGRATAHSPAATACASVRSTTPGCRRSGRTWRTCSATACWRRRQS